MMIEIREINKVISFSITRTFVWTKFLLMPGLIAHIMFKILALINKFEIWLRFPKPGFVT